MDTMMHIAEVAERSGFPAATLRYYEQVKLLSPPRRTTAGYRTYDESVLARLAFIARAKSLGCSLGEIGDLLPDWEGGQCAPLQERLRHLAATKVDEVDARIAELTAFGADLHRILSTLGAHTPDGPCDDDCGCVADTSAPAPSAPVSCTLDAAQLPNRLEEWRRLLGHTIGRTQTDGCVRLMLDDTTPVDQLAELAQAEHGCCSFFAFAITVDDRGLGLEVRAPAEALSVVDALLGSPAEYSS